MTATSSDPRIYSLGPAVNPHAHLLLGQGVKRPGRSRWEPHGAGGGEGGAPSLTAGSPAPRAGPGIKVCRIDDLQIMALKADLVPNQL